MKRPNDLLSSKPIGKQIGYKNNNIRFIDKDYISTKIELKQLLQIEYNAIVEDLNANPNIIELEIDFESLFSFKNKDTLSIFPFDQLQHIQYLSLKSVSDRRLRIKNWAIIANMPNLKYLNIIGFNVSSIPDDVMVILLKRLKGLGMWNQQMALPKTDHNLQELYLQVEPQFVLQSLKNLTTKNQLNKLRISRVQFNNELVNEIAKFDSLEWIEFNNCSYVDSTDLSPHNFSQLKDLSCAPKFLFVIKNNEKTIEKLKTRIGRKSVDLVFNEINTHVNLRHLDLDLLDTDTLNMSSLVGLDKIEYLRIYGKIKSLDKSIGNFKSLITLDLKRNELGEFPESITRLDKLVSLDLQNNKISNLPDLGKMTHLRILKLGGNKLTKLPSSVTNLKNLENLDLANNPLIELPINLGELRSLKKLDLNTSCLKEIPESIGKLNELNELTILSKQKTCKNIRTVIPPSLGKCQNLQKLRIRKASISKGLISDLLKTKIEVLSLGDCNIKSLPDQGWSKSKLKDLYLYDNQISEIPKDLLASEIDKINLKKNEAGIYSQQYKSKTQKKLAAYNLNFIDRSELLEEPDVISTIIELCSKYYSPSSKSNPINIYLPLAMELDGKQVLDKIDPENIAELFEKNKQYEEAIKYYSIAIDQDTSSSIQFSNSIASNIQKRGNIYLNTGDTLKAIQDFELIQRKYGYNMSSTLYELYLTLDQADSVKNTALRLVKRYEELERKDSTSIDMGIQLSILEVYLTSGLREEFRTLSSKLNNQLMSTNYRYIFEYLNVLYDMEFAKDRNHIVSSWVNNKLWNDYKNNGWSCDVINNWARHKSSSFKHGVLLLNQKVCP